MAAIKGLGKCSTSMNAAWLRRDIWATRSRVAGFSRSKPPSPPMALISAPAMKYRSIALVSTTTRVASSSLSRLRASTSSSWSSATRALTGGRFIRMVVTKSLVEISSEPTLKRKEVHTARHRQRDARDVAGSRRAEKGDGVGDVLRLAGPSHRDPLHHPLVHVWPTHLEGLGGDHAGHDGIAGDVVPRSLQRQRAGEADEPGFRRRIARLAEAAEAAGNRRHHDDPTPVALFHMRPDGFRAVIGAGEIDLQVAVPERIHLVVDGRHVVERAGIIDQDVQAAEFLHDLVDDGFDLFPVGDVHFHRHRAPAQIADLAGRLLRADGLR